LKIKSQKDFWSGVMFIALGVAFAWGATAYKFGTTANPGPGYFPFGLGVMLAVLGALVLFTSLTIETEGGDLIGAFAWRPFLVVLGAVAIFGYTLPVFGMLVALPLLIVISAAAGDQFSLKAALISAVVLTAACWVMFVWGLNLTIPMRPTVFGFGG
jgi:hypothetical protein